MQAVVRWLFESAHKKSLADDKNHLKWLNTYFKHLNLKDISRAKIDVITQAKLKEGVKPATVNRMLEIVRAILRKAEREWEWIDRAPAIRMLKVDNRRIRWITKEEAGRLIQVLPNHLADMATFALATGLRKSNLTGLRWQDIDLVRNHAWVHPDEAKAKIAISVPLNTVATATIQKQIGKHKEFVFVYRGTPISQCNTKAWKKD